MSRYKEIMFKKGILHKELLETIKRVDDRVDKSLLSKIVNDNCLPTPQKLDSICGFINCDVLDIYDIPEIDLLHSTSKLNNLSSKTQYAVEIASNNVATLREDRGGLSHGSNIYNLTVEIKRDIAERVFSKKALRKLGYLSKTDCIRQFVYALDKKYQKILEKEKAVKGNNTHLND